MAMENPHGWTDGWLHSDPYPGPEMSRSPINTKRMRPAIVLRNRPIAIGSNGSKMCHAPPCSGIFLCFCGAQWEMCG